MSKPSLFDMLDQVRPDLEPLAPHFMTDKELVEKARIQLRSAIPD